MVELLAPAGDKECFRAAITSGADAVYVGGKRYGARAYAGNFETEDLIECMQLAHLHEKKVYLTVNTLMKESEIDELASFLRPFYEEGLDGVIVQDLGALRYSTISLRLFSIPFCIWRIGASIFLRCLLGARVRSPSAVGSSRLTLILSTRNPVRSINSGAAPGIAFTCIYPLNRYLLRSR